MWACECQITFQSSSLSVVIFTLLAFSWNVKSAQRRNALKLTGSDCMVVWAEISFLKLMDKML